VKNPDAFYVGYHPRMPRELAPFVRNAVLLLLLGVAALAVVVPVLHDAYPVALSEWPTQRNFVGILQASPAPHLVVARPGTGSDRRSSRYVLVGQGKTGPIIDVSGLDGKPTRVRGWLVFRGAQTLIATVSAEEIPATESGLPVEPGGGESLGTMTLRGEIVDSKCYFGTMRPGNSKVHRGCAARCISGGVPPIFISRDPAGNEVAFLIVATDGSAVNQRVLHLVAEPLEITGKVVRLGDAFVIKTDPETYRRL